MLHHTRPHATLLFVLLFGATASAQYDRPDARFRPPPSFTLGVQARPTDTGVVVMNVTRYSNAATVGIERGDTIITVDGQQVGYVGRRQVDLDQAIDTATRGDRSARLLLRNGRNGQLLNVEVRNDPGFTPDPGFNPAGGGGNPMRGQLSQVRKWYLQFLKREIAPPELQSWEDHLRGGQSIEQIQDRILSSDEYYKICGGDDIKFIGGLFRDVLRRNPVSPEGSNWLNLLKQLRGNRLRLAEQFRTTYQLPFP